jgi:hypothetical protein
MCIFSIFHVFLLIRVISILLGGRRCLVFVIIRLKFVLLSQTLKIFIILFVLIIVSTSLLIPSRYVQTPPI